MEHTGPKTVGLLVSIFDRLYSGPAVIGICSGGQGGHKPFSLSEVGMEVMADPAAWNRIY